ncbi:TonB-linked SusC/RagA family outer membrane protein [Mucilaginibacter frigoritolerans]|uniref:TonB-linked SusC/RagA family outer membrane protein n=1 Tax=Mucilaginibacter frigoritolerans TaxID=652788 RepID=A0A562UGJ9_9SPHI|nr:SusC/RagA family TonB-linked outer membrane protein [Mucilaginibacter frigoritolerans]TWJ04966.1 TonB-linked SusC/RagA family outer membrane protein [Mucilaginibacter frigoritolerans]
MKFYLHGITTHEPTSLYRKIFLVMKVAIILVIICSLQVKAAVYAQKITLTEKNASLEKIFKEIKEQAGYTFFYENKLLKNTHNVDINVKDASLNEVLEQCLAGQSLSYGISGKTIVITPKPTIAVNHVDADIHGKVTDEKGAPLPGATVKVKGTDIGVTSDVNGSFKVNLPAKLTGNPVILTASFIGYKTEEITVTDFNSPVIIKLVNSASSLNTVVVTALGINKEQRSIGYAATVVQGSDFTQARENNVAAALTGKVAGVNAIGASTGPGGSSRVIIRGDGSLSGTSNNQPLYVINGMPIDNTVPGGSASSNGGGFNIDRGDGIADINPDDIETITVLKGGTAAALYGSRAANGVILITTKKGKAQKGVGVEFNSTATMETIAVKPDFQYEYGQGNLGVKPTTLAAAQATGRLSWGSKIDGSTNYVGVDGLTHPYVAQKNNLDNYYQNGSTYTNTLALSGGTEAVTYRFSVADLNSKGILPGTTYDRKTGNLSLSGKLSPKLTFEALAQYNVETGHNRTSAGDATGNPNWSPYMIANTANVQWLKPGYDANGNETVWNDASVATNGYFVINKFKEDDTKNRFIGQGSIAYEFAKDLILKATISQDHFDYNWTDITPTGTLYQLNGQYVGLKSDLTETNGLATLSYKKQVSDFGMSFLTGVNKRHSAENDLNLSGTGFIIPYFYSYNNLTAPTTTITTLHQDVNSAFGSADFNYKSVFYVGVTGRNDWFSTLSPKNNSIFYPSVNASLILSDIFKLPAVFNSLKLKGAYSEVGGGAPDPYAINLTYSNVSSSGPPLQNVSSNTGGSGVSGITNQNLKPYTSTTSEGGIEGQMFGNRLNFDLTYYNRLTKNDIVNATISSTSGYNSVYLNTGKLRNRGIEALIGGSPIKRPDFGWNVSYNFSYNDNKVLYLTNGITSMNLASTVGNWGNINNIVGYSAFELVETSMLKDAHGNVVFNSSSGLPVQAPLHPVGKTVAPVTMGLTNTFRYKRFSLDVLLDGKFGNKVFSISEVYETRLGLLKTTLPGRANGLTVTGVDQTGKPYTETIPVSGLHAYYDNYKNYGDLFLHDGSFVKLRQVLLSYSIPVNNLKLFKIQSLNLSLVARNLAILYKKTDGFDPEESYSNSNYQGFESVQLPRTRSFGLNLSVKF